MFGIKSRLTSLINGMGWCLRHRRIKTIKVHALENRPRYTLFEEKSYIRDNRIEFVDNPERADIITASEIKCFTDYYLSLNRINILWTREPYYDRNMQFVVHKEGSKSDIYVFNIYNKNVYHDNFYYCQRMPKLTNNDSKNFEDKSSVKKIVALMTAKSYSLVHNDVEYSLTRTRRDLALALHGAGLLDIYGNRWPDGVALGETRAHPQWLQIKRQILRRYDFCFCPENTLWDYYVTEKIWDSIEAGAMPIYYPNATLPADVPSELYLALPRSASAGDVAEMVNQLTAREYRERMNALIDLRNRYVAEWRFAQSRAKTAKALTDFIMNAL